MGDGGAAVPRRDFFGDHKAVLNIVVDPVRHDLNISDEQIGLLQGLAFGLFYACVGMPMGLMADRVSRKTLANCLPRGCWSGLVKRRWVRQRSR